MSYLLLISLVLFSFFSYHACSSCFPNPYPKPQAFPRSFFGSHLASILNLTDKTCVYELWSWPSYNPSVFPIEVIIPIEVIYSQTRWSLYEAVFSSLSISLWPSCVILHSWVTCWLITLRIAELGKQRGSMGFSVRQKWGFIQIQTH